MIVLRPFRTRRLAALQSGGTPTVAVYHLPTQQGPMLYLEFVLFLNTTTPLQPPKVRGLSHAKELLLRIKIRLYGNL